jgi:hypothetical protein
VITSRSIVKTRYKKKWVGSSRSISFDTEGSHTRVEDRGRRDKGSSFRHTSYDVMYRRVGRRDLAPCPTNEERKQGKSDGGWRSVSGSQLNYEKGFEHVLYIMTTAATVTAGTSPSKWPKKRFRLQDQRIHCQEK